MRRLGLEAASLTLCLDAGNCRLGALAHLGYAAWIGPLALVSASLLQLFAIFVVVGRRGMLKPR